MAWPGPSIRFTGDLITATIYNGDLIASLKALAPVVLVKSSGAVSIASTSSTAPTDVISSGVVTLEARALRVDFFAPQINTPDSAADMHLSLWDGSTDLGVFAVWSLPTATVAGPCQVSIPLSALSAGSHTLKVRGYKSGGSGAAVVAAAGGAGTAMNMSLAIHYAEY